MPGSFPLRARRDDGKVARDHFSYHYPGTSKVVEEALEAPDQDFFGKETRSIPLHQLVFPYDTKQHCDITFLYRGRIYRRTNADYCRPSTSVRNPKAVLPPREPTREERALADPQAEDTSR